MLNQDLLSNGFTRSKADQCVYVKPSPHGNIYLSVHVDDMLIATPSKASRLWFESTFSHKYELTGQHQKISYIGMSIAREPTGIVVNQLGYIENMAIKYLPKHEINYPSVPAVPALLKQKSTESPISPKKYLSIVMTLMYLALHTRPDILIPVTYLATKSSKPSAEYYSDAVRIVAYVANTKHFSMQFSSSASMLPSIFADASHLLHSDARGHGGIILSLGSAPILTKSYKLKLNTKSSTESELVVLEQACSDAKWWLLLLSELEISNANSIKILQDNMSAITMVEKEQFHNLNKHLVNRVNLIKEDLLTNIISIEYCPTGMMVADILTKICDKATIKKLLSLMNFHLHEDRPR
jgi:hypothetical protein